MSIADLRATLEYVKTHRNEYSPDTWFSGTTADLAGHLVMRAGWTPVEEADPGFVPVVVNGDKGKYVTFVANSIAGVSDWEGHCLWAATNTLERLDRLVTRLERDQAIYETLFLPTDAYTHAWTNYQDRIAVAVHRRTTFSRVGSGLVQIRDWATRQDAQDHALELAAGRSLTYHHAPEA